MRLLQNLARLLRQLVLSLQIQLRKRVLLSKEEIPRKIQFYGGPKDGEIMLNIVEVSKVVFYEEKQSSKKAKEPDLTLDRRHFLHKYELLKRPDGNYVYNYKGIV